MLFTGEMVFPWLFDDFGPLRPYKAAAQLLAAKADWPDLYKPGVLARNCVPLAAAVYLEDMYVDYNLCQETMGSIGSVRAWVTNEFKHRCAAGVGLGLGRMLVRASMGSCRRVCTGARA